MIIVCGLSAGVAAAAVRTSVAAALEVIDVKQPEARPVNESLCHHHVAFLCLTSKVTVIFFAADGSHILAVELPQTLMVQGV